MRENNTLKLQKETVTCVGIKTLGAEVEALIDLPGKGQGLVHQVDCPSRGKNR